MKILLSVEDIIKRCLWVKYRKFILKKMNDEEIKKIIEENKLIEISEEDAYVIGLLKVVQTDNISHQFNVYLSEFLKIKSTINDDIVMINKSALLKEIIEYKGMFPVEYKPCDDFQKRIDELNDYISIIYDGVNELDEIKINFKDKVYTFVRSSDVNKIINKYMYKI